MKISDIKVGNRFRKDLGDIETLMESIKKVGLLHPIVVQKETNKLIAGGRRLVCCKKLGWKEIEINLITLKDIIQGEFHENSVRKNFSVTEAVEIYEYIESHIEELRKEDGSESEPKDKFNNRILMRAAKYMGTSHDTLQKMRDIVKAAKEEPEKHGHILEDIEGGQSVNYAHKSLKNVVKQNTPTPDLPKDKFELVELDPPWAYDLALQGSPPYKTMTLEEMKKEIPELPAHKDSIMFMWATNPKLNEAIDLMQFYGFEYKTNIVWVKQKEGKLQTGTGYYVHGAHELLLIGTKGGPGVPPESLRVPSVVFSERTKHSAKPEIFYEIMESYYPAKKKLSMFSRKKRTGWITWGDQADSKGR